MTRLPHIVALALLAAIPAGAAYAQTYPDKPIRVIVPNEAGGSTDRNLRIIASYLEEELGTSIAVLNVAGGGTSVGSRQAIDAARDGYTVLFNHQALLVAAAMGVIDLAEGALEPVAQTGSEYLAIVVNAASEITSLEDLVEAAQAAPDTLRYGVQVGAFNHFAALAFEEATDTDFRYVNTGGGGPTRVALLGNHIDVSFSTTGDIGQFVESGEIRVLAVMAPERASALPDAPTSAEAGYDVLTELKYWWWLPAGVPEDVRDRLGSALEAIMADPALIEDLAGVEVSATFVEGSAAQVDVTASLERMQGLAAAEGLR
jgi:tripartite-type tricarboxylate transporter receptor subunit TctC